MGIEWKRSATKHRISRERSGYVVQFAKCIFHIPAPEGAADDRLLFLGRDAEGQLLEVLALATDTGLIVIHAMSIRKKYLPYYKEPD